MSKYKSITKGWGATPGMWGAEQKDSSEKYTMKDAAMQLRQEPVGSLITLLRRRTDGSEALQVALVVTGKILKNVKHMAMGNRLHVKLYFDSLEHVDTGVIVTMLLVEVSGIRKTFRGFIDISDISSRGTLSLLKNTIGGPVDLMFVSPEGKFISLEQLTASEDTRMEEALGSAIQEFVEYPWSVDEFAIAAADVIDDLEALDIRTIDQHIEAREAAGSISDQDVPDFED